MKYAILNTLLGAAIGCQALLYPPLAVPLLWLGVSFAALGIAYLRRSPAVLGKRANGTVAWWSWICFLPLHLYIQLVWNLMRILSREPALNRVSPTLVVGRRLLASEFPPDIKVVVDLTAEFPETAGIRGSGDYRLFPLLDATVPDLEKLRAFIATLPNLPTYVHCAQGHGRTGLFALAYLVRRRVCANLSEAESLLQTVRPGIKLNHAQRRFILSLPTSHPP